MSSVTLLITTWNRTPQLEKSLRRLFDGTLTLPDEMLIINDGGTDDVEGMLKRLDDEIEIPIPYRCIYNHQPELSICCLARNIGIKNTETDLVIISEPEIWFMTDVVRQLIEGWHKTHNVVSAGIVYHAQEQWMTQPEQCNRIEGWVAPYVGIYSREALLAINGYDESFPGAWGWDDVDLLTRLRVNGINQDIDRSIEVMHQWHINPGRDQVGALANDKHFLNKTIELPEHAVTNVGREWGVLIPRP